MKIECSKEFLKAETRCDYFVSEEHKKIWAVQLDLLQELMEACDKLHIKCFAQAGTLLGAIRHKGFIPWDDDMDIGLSRKDYNILIKNAKKVFKEPYFLQTNNTDRKVDIPYARFRRSDTTCYIKGCPKTDYNNGIYIDIHAWEALPEEKKLQKLHKKTKLLRKLRYFSRNKFKWLKTRSFFKNIAVACFTLIIKCVPYSYLCWKSEKLYAKYSKTNNMNADIIVLSIYPCDCHYKFKLGDIQQLDMVDFEYIKIPVPHNYLYHLETSYGDWKKFPPKEKLGEWHGNGLLTFDPDTPYKEFLEKHNI